MSQAFCTHCGKPILPGAKFCVHCGQPQPAATAATPAPAASLASGVPPAATPQAVPAQPHSSAHAAASMDVPPGVKGWSWGAFWLNWVWAVFNKTWIGLLALVPVVNLLMPFVLGFKGREWAWRKGSWRSVEHFRQVQRKWDIAGWVLLAAVVVVAGVAAFVANRPYSSTEPIQTTQESRPEGAELPKAARSDAPYPLPRVGYTPLNLAAAMIEAGIDGPWPSELESYLEEPKDYWRKCVEGGMSFSNRLGGLKGAEAREWAEQSCRQTASDFFECLDGKSLAAGVACIKKVTDEYGQTGD